MPDEQTYIVEVSHWGRDSQGKTFRFEAGQVLTEDELPAGYSKVFIVPAEREGITEPPEDQTENEEV